MSFILKNGKLLTSGGKVINVKGGATISTEKWSGVSVINMGYLENVYFNTNLSIEEVIKILNRLDYSNEESNEYEFYGVFKTLTSNQLYLKIIKNGNDYLIKLYDDSGSIQANIFSTNLENGFIGWSDIVLNDNCCIVDNNVGYFIDGYHYGLQNNIISSLISETPFTEIENEVVTLEGDYDGLKIEVEDTTIDVKALIEQKKIPLEIMVKNVYKWVTLEGTPIDGGFDFGVISQDMWDKNIDNWNGFLSYGYVEWDLTGLGLITLKYDYRKIKITSTMDKYLSYTPVFVENISSSASSLGLYNYLRMLIELSYDSNECSFKLKGSNTFDYKGDTSWYEYPVEIVNQFVSITKSIKLHLLVK